jgi:hypothetical protein
MPTFKKEGTSVTGSSSELLAEAKAAGFVEVTTQNEGVDGPEAELHDELGFIDDLAPAEFFAGYEPDWADEIIHKCATWKGWDAPRWLPKALQRCEWALLQLPAPDRRYIAKSWNGISVFPARGWPARGFRYLKELIETGTITHRIGGRGGAELLKGDAADDSEKPEQSASKSGEKLKGCETQRIDPATLARFKALQDRGEFTVKPDTELERLDTAADDFNRQVRSAIDYVLKVVAKQDSLVAIELNNSIQLKNGAWVFATSRKWATSLESIPYDCSMTLRGDMWETSFTGQPFYVKDCAGMRYVARILACGNVPAPSALIAGGDLLSEFLTRPPYHRLFRAMYRKEEVKCNDRRNGEIERAICEAKKLKPEHCFHATDQLTKTSDLHTICGLSTGLVILDADGLTAIHSLVAKQLVMMEPDDPKRSQVKQIADELRIGIRFSKMYKTLLQHIQPACDKAADTIRQAVYRLRKQLLEDQDRSCERFAKYIQNHVTTGELCEHQSGLRWKVEGIQGFDGVLQV